MKTPRSILPLLLALAAASAGALAADPTGRIPVGANTTPGDATSRFKITQPGSYYLAANLVGVSVRYGILISSGDVTLDLNGMTVIGDGATPGSGIRVSSAQGPVRIFNGSVRNWKGAGIQVVLSTVDVDSVDVSDNGGNGIELLNEVSAIITDCSADENSGAGFYAAAERVTFVNCRASDNGIGFRVGNATLRGCTAERNRQEGFFATNGTLENCAARSNQKNGILAYNSTIQQCSVVWNQEHGITTDQGVVEGCTVNGNFRQGILATKSNVQSCTVLSNGYSGIHATDSRVASCNVYGNTINGIEANGSTLVVGNQVSGHSGGSDAGIYVRNGSNRIEDNNLTGNYYGIAVVGTVNFIARNSARSSFRNYGIAAGNRVGTIVVPVLSGAISGNSGGGTGTTDPWSNIAY